MTDLILETNDGKVYYIYISDGKDRVVFISGKRSWVERPYRPPREYRKLMALVRKLVER